MILSDWALFFANYYRVLESLAALTAIVILISSIDDLFIDAWYWTLRLYRKFVIHRRSDYQPLPVQALEEKPQQHLAIMVPAWLEYDVIAQMIENMVSVLDYQHYVVFVGTYINDAATINEVERMRRRYRQLIRVEVPHAGPTCKADCLNWIVQAIFLHEKQKQIEFAGVILHDSEDVLHPLELKFFNYLLPRKDMIQLPVISLERNWYELVAGTYMDEFAESHAKDMVVRESLAGMVPSAGVGTCFSRRALLMLAEQTNNQPFNTDSLTEDYDVGSRLTAMKMSSIFARYTVQFRVLRKTWFGLRPDRELVLDMPLCVREFFPNEFRASYRQKARWVLGISMQGWEQHGWAGSLAVKYLLFRDRKGIVTSFVSILAYLLFLQFLLFYIAGKLHWWELRFPPLFGPGSWIMVVAEVTLATLLLRIVQRYYFVAQLYGWEHGLMSIPRLLVGNLINFFAVARAWKLFLTYLLMGKRLVWDKTMHHFPSTDQLAQKRQLLGELLTSWKAVDPHVLDAALVQQNATQLPLGQILLAQGSLSEETLAEAIACQYQLDRGTVDFDNFHNYANILPNYLSVRYRTVVIGVDHKNVYLAVASPLSEQGEQTLREHFLRQDEKQVVQRIVCESEIRTCLRILRGMANAKRESPLLGDILLAQGSVNRDEFEQAMAHYSADYDHKIGDYLIRQGLVNQEQLTRAIQEQARLNKNQSETSNQNLNENLSEDCS